MQAPISLETAGIDPKKLEAIHRGKDFEALYGHQVYKRIMDWFQFKSQSVLQELKDTRSIDNDRTKANIVNRWTCVEEVWRDFDSMVADAIADKYRIIEELEDEHGE